MVSEVTIPQGDQKIMVELTIKEAMALSEGIHFHQNRSLSTQARKKIRRELAKSLIPGEDRINYRALEI